MWRVIVLSDYGAIKLQIQPPDNHFANVDPFLLAVLVMCPMSLGGYQWYFKSF